MKLSDLLKALDAPGLAHEIHGPAQAEISGLTADSRRAGPGMLFAALKGVAVDGHAYLAQAAAAGAAALLVERPDRSLTACPQVVVADSRLALALMAHEFCGRPTAGMTLVGITGTNGKTTTSYLVESVLAAAGPVGVIGTVEVRYDGVRRPADMTTPEPVELMDLLARMRAAGVAQAVMEVSSHALDQRRVDGCLFDAGVFTNLSRDHLDYHGDLATYFAAKRRFFAELLPAAQAAGKNPVAVICLDDPHAEELAALCLGLGLKVLTYGLAPAAQVRLAEEKLGLAGSACRVIWPGGEFALSTPLVGEYNLQNTLAAAAVGLALGVHPTHVAQGLMALAGVPGRLERVPGPTGAAAVFVDYAHTDDALTKALGALKPLTKGRLICVFGAGGDRDHGKRPLMGRAVGQGADLAVLTSDNPRSEEPQAIMAMVEEGLRQAGARPIAHLDQAKAKAYVSEPDRALAIALAVGQARSEDVVLIAGKGHEDYQVVGRSKRHFDDREQAAAALAHRGRWPGEAAHA
jgi:UDP-N-acetylmuramoyl-L-alanyl-D-glutamate--2,6-diaminopimelate ligase